MSAQSTTWVNAIRAIKKTSDGPSWFDSELAWFVNQREGELGVRGMPLEPGTGGDPLTDDGISDHQIRSATRARRVETALTVLTPEGRLMVLAAHLTISPRAHKEKHAAQERFLSSHGKEIAVAVAMFRGAWGRR